MKKRFGVLAILCGGAGILFAQEDSRAAEIAALQQEKASQAEPEKQNRVERSMLWVRDGNIIQKLSTGVDGVHATMGGVAPGSGFAVGPAFTRRGLLNGALDLKAAARLSTRGAQKYDLEASLPRLAGRRMFADVYLVHHRYPSLSYYGSGPDTHKSGRTDFLLEDTAFDATLGRRIGRRMSAGVSAGYLLNNIGPGHDDRYASTESVYSPAQAPGIDVQTNYARTGGFAQYDWRDNADGPRRGGNYFAQFSDYRAQTGAASFRRLDLEAQQYVSVLNQRRVFAVRGKSTVTFKDGGAAIPFYMQPSLGGSEDLRGYRPFRFRGDNLVLANAEYRWEVFSGLDMAVFADAGKVFSREQNFTMRHLESDAGFGFRFNARNKTFLRLDVAFSHEGFQVWVKFNNVFKKGPVRTSSSMGDL
jgi:outer membrane protein assembly factor BamA